MDPWGKSGTYACGVTGHGPPLDAVFQDVEYGLDDLPSRHFCRAASRLGGGDQRLQDGPLLVRQIAGVKSTCRSHPSSVVDFYDSLSHVYVRVQ